MRKLILALLLLCSELAHAQIPPYGIYVTQADVSTTFFWGRYFVPTVPTNSYFFMYNGGNSQPKMGEIGAGLNWDGTTLSATGTGSVTSITAGTGLNGGVITTSGTISMPSVGSAGTYSGVTTDAQGRVTAGTAISINDSPGRALVTATNAIGFQVSATRNSRVCYEGAFSTTSTIGGPASATVFLETADTNSTTPSDWTTKSRQTYSNNITLAVVLNQVQGNNWTMCRDIPAGKFVRIRSGSITGTASVSINSEQQETTL